MAESVNNLEAEVLEIVNAECNPGASKGHKERPQDTAAPIKPADAEQGHDAEQIIHVESYSLPNGDLFFRLPSGEGVLVPGEVVNPFGEQTVVESGGSTAETFTIPLTHDAEQEETAKGPAALGTKRRGQPSSVLLPLLLLFALAAGDICYWYLLPLSASATITITPKTRSLQTTTTLTIAAHPNSSQVQGRELEPIRFTKSATVPATGNAHQDATQATGVLTFYNADSQSYTLPAGVTFTAPSGVTIATDQAVVVQAAVLPEVGIAISAAHVLQAGSIGNIAAHALYTRCCGSEFLTATNLQAFSGGADARTYRFIQTSDIQNSATDLLNSLTPKATTALTHHVRAGEQLLPPWCTPQTTSDQEAGVEATSVRISVTQTCRSVAYSLDSLEQVSTRMLTHAASLAHYAQAATVHVTVTDSLDAGNTAKLRVTLSGLWVYRLSHQDLSSLKTLIAGKSQEQAQQILNREGGLAQASIHLQRFDFKDQLPTDTAQISIQLFYLVS